MANLVFSSIIGSFVFNDKFKVIDKARSNKVDKLIKKHKETRKELKIFGSFIAGNSFEKTINLIQKKNLLEKCKKIN